MSDTADPSLTLFQIDWNRHSAAQWQTMLDNCARPTLPQRLDHATNFLPHLGYAAMRQDSM